MKKYSCEKCLYSTDLKFCFEQHKISKTHIKKENDDYEGKFKCKICCKEYKSKNGYYTHRKNCIIDKNKKEEERLKEEEIEKKKEYEEIKKIIIDLYKQNNEIIKENSEMKNMLVEISKKDNIMKIENIDNSQNTNSNNKIDINIFLNEKCKNAINMSSLIETIVIGIKDIENIQKYGYVKTITDIVSQKLDDYSIYNRPIHYYVENKKDEDEEMPNDIIHIRDNDKWNKEDMYDHDLLLTNMNTINDACYEKTKEIKILSDVVRNGRRYNKTGTIIKNILDKVKINEEQICEK